jgi:hypothetical protein
VNEITRRQLRNRKRRIEYRLRDKEWAPQDRPMFAGSNLHFEIAERTRAIEAGGVPAMHALAIRVGLKRAIDERVQVLKVHKPYHESDHVMNIALNVLAGGTCLEDLELRRNNENYLDALGAQRIPDPTTAGDFCRRFKQDDVEALMAAINESRVRVWRLQPSEFFERAIIEADGTMAPTTGEKKEGMDVSYDGQWGYHPLVVSLANTAEPLFLVNRSGNRPSHEGASQRFDQAIDLVRRAGFRKVLLRGDTDFSQTEQLDRWHAAGAEFVFGYNAVSNLRETADRLKNWRRLNRPAKYTVKTELRDKRKSVKEQVVHDRAFKNIRLQGESVAEFDYQPAACKQSYRMVVVRKNLVVQRGQPLLFPDIRYFFYITNRRDLTAQEIVFQANDRCDQENLIAQLKAGVRAMRMPTDTLMSNWAHMVMTALAWSLKAWFALILPAEPRWLDKHAAQKRALLRMEFRSFLNAVIHVPAQVVRTGRRIVVRFLGWTRWLGVFFRGVDALHGKLAC